MTDKLKKSALEYHAHPRPGKVALEITKPAETQEDLSLAYSPGVAEPCLEISRDPEAAYLYTAKGNTVAVITNGSAVLGLGNLGSLASKPVMEGKALLFKRFGGVDATDIEIATESPQVFIDTVVPIADTWGGINLEDIKAPECFEIEKTLIERCNIPVFHDDQHGTAIVILAGLLNALEIQGKSLEKCKVVCLGAGAAATASAMLMINAGLKKENLLVLDRKGVIHSGRDDLNSYKAFFAGDASQRTLDDAIEGADVFLGLSGPDLLSADQLKKMASKPIVFACSNPNPEINPELALRTRDDLIMATGRSDYSNQVNNVLAFPYIFRGTLDVRARHINDEMKLAAAYAIAELAKQPVPQSVIDANGGIALAYGAEYIIPKPMDLRLLAEVSAAVARAAVDTGVASRPYPEHYPLNSLKDIKY